MSKSLYGMWVFETCLENINIYYRCFFFVYFPYGLYHVIISFDCLQYAWKCSIFGTSDAVCSKQNWNEYLESIKKHDDCDSNRICSFCSNTWNSAHMCKLKHKYHNSKGEKKMNCPTFLIKKKKSVSKSNKKNIYSLWSIKVHLVTLHHLIQQKRLHLKTKQSLESPVLLHYRGKHNHGNTTLK